MNNLVCPNSAGLNHQYAAGIAVGAVLVGLLLAAAAGFFLRRTHRRRHARLQCQPSTGNMEACAEPQASGGTSPHNPLNPADSRTPVQAHGELRSSFEAQAPRKLHVSRTPEAPAAAPACEGGLRSPQTCITDVLPGPLVSGASSPLSAAPFGEVQPDGPSLPHGLCEAAVSVAAANIKVAIRLTLSQIVVHLGFYTTGWPVIVRVGQGTRP